MRMSGRSERAALDNLSGFKHENLVGGKDRRQPVGDRKRGAAFHQLA
jgi:hypothetical protein